MVRMIMLVLCTVFQLIFVPRSAMCADEPAARNAIDAQVSALADPQAALRDRAAANLRTILSKTGGVAPGDRDEIYWAQKLQAIKIGMSKAEVEQIIPPKEDVQPTLGQGMGSYSVQQRLDKSWSATLYFDPSNKIYAAPKLSKSVLSVWVPPAPDYTGKWTTYFVNGQKSNEIEYKDGEYNGAYTNYYPDGKTCYEQHYVNGESTGTDRGWHANGQPSYAGQYDRGKQVGLWTWWNPDGTKQKEVDHK